LAELSNLSKLTRLWVSDNELSGYYDESLSVLCDQLISDNPDSDINYGNDFDSFWTSFCLCNSISTDLDLEIDINTTYQNIHQTGGNIITVGEVCINLFENVIYHATTTTLNSGFEAKKGSDLSIIPNDCE